MMASNKTRWAGERVAGPAMALSLTLALTSACWTNPTGDATGDIVLSCGADSDCPPDWTCRTDAVPARCLSPEGITTPTVDILELTSRVGAGQDVVLRFTVSEALRGTPAVRADIGAAELNFAVEEDGTEGFSARYTAKDGDPEGEATLRFELVTARFGLPQTVNGASSFIIDLTAPSIAAASTVEPTLVGADTPVLVSVVTNEVLQTAPEVRLQRDGQSRAAVLLTQNDTVFTYSYIASEDPEDGGANLFEDGPYDVVVRAVDEAGNVSPDARVGGVRFDVTPPALELDTTVSFLPAAGALVADVSALGPQGTAVVRFTSTESLSTAPRVRLEDRQFTNQSPGANLAFTYRLNLSTPLADGVYDVAVELVDDAGNANNVVLSGLIPVDTTPPAVNTVEGAIRLARRPWGAEASGGQPQLSVSGLAGAVEPGATLILWSEADIQKGAELARVEVPEGGDGSFPETVLPVEDRFRIYYTAVDGAGNVHRDDGLASVIRRGSYGVSLRGKVVGDLSVNPHRLNVRGFAETGREGSTGPVGELGGAVVGSVDGVMVTTRAAPHWVSKRQVSFGFPLFGGDELAWVYDTWRDRVVGVQSSETSTFRADAWTTTFSEQTPQPSRESATVFDDARGVVVHFGIDGFGGLRVSEFDGEVWRPLPPVLALNVTGDPVEIHAVSATYDAIQGETILVGTSLFNDVEMPVYTYSRGALVLHATEGSPTPRVSGVALAALDGDLYMFGGYDVDCAFDASPASCIVQNDLWRLNRSIGEWSVIGAGNAPPKRSRANLHARPEMGTLELRGGRPTGFDPAPPGFTANTWRVEPQAGVVMWTAVSDALPQGEVVASARAPDGRQWDVTSNDGLTFARHRGGAGAPWAEAGAMTDEFGGVSVATPGFGDGFVRFDNRDDFDTGDRVLQRRDWLAGGWSAPVGPDLPPNDGFFTAYDSSRQTVVMIGGFGDFAPLDQVAIYDLNSHEVTVTSGAGFFDFGWAAYDPDSDSVIVVSPVWSGAAGNEKVCRIALPAANTCIVIPGFANTEFYEVDVARHPTRPVTVVAAYGQQPPGSGIESFFTWEIDAAFAVTQTFSGSLGDNQGAFALGAYDGEIVLLHAGAVWRYGTAPAPRWQVEAAMDAKLRSDFGEPVTLFRDGLNTLGAQVGGRVFTRAAADVPTHTLHMSLANLLPNIAGAEIVETRVDWTAGGSGGVTLEAFTGGAWRAQASSPAPLAAPESVQHVFAGAALNRVLTASGQPVVRLRSTARGAGTELATDGAEVTFEFLLRDAVCGDGQIVSGVEQCDDGNNVDGDGCSRNCVIELGGNCNPDNGICLPLGSPCPVEYLSDGICDCGCGVDDPDCTNAESIAMCFDNCSTIGKVIDPTNPAACIFDLEVVTCDTSVFGDGLLCDCGCGVADPDCFDSFGVAACDVNHCMAPATVDAADQSQCVVGICATVNLADDICVCGCGLLDADCPTENDISACDVDGCGDGAIDPNYIAVCVDEGRCPGAFANGQCDCGCEIPDPECVAEPVQCDINNCDVGFSPDPNNPAFCMPDGPCAGKIDVGDGCDCGCGILDPDCTEALVVENCASEVCGPDLIVDPSDVSQCVPPDVIGPCVTGIDAGDGVCDCGCGVFDSDCPGEAVADCDTSNCQGNADVDPFNIGQCIANVGCLDGFEDNGSCDCGCGAPDPDCANHSSSSLCDTAGCGDNALLDDDDTTQCIALINGCSAIYISADDTLCDCGCGVFDTFSCTSTTDVTQCLQNNMGYNACPGGTVVDDANIGQCKPCPGGSQPDVTRTACVPI